MTAATRPLCPAESDSLNAFDRFLDIRKRVRVAEAQIAVAVLTERCSPQTCHSGFVQQQVRQFFGWHASARDIRKGIECARRQCAPPTWNGVEALHHDVATSPEFRDHRGHRVLWTFEGGNARALGETCR